MVTSHVHIQYRTPYVPGWEVPDDTIKLMRHEISYMRKNLLVKQERLRNSEEFSDNPQLTEQLHALRVKDLKTDRQVQDTWNRLWEIEHSRFSSITTKREMRDEAIETLHNHGFEEINRENYEEFTEYMEKIDDFTEARYLSSDIFVNYFLTIYDKYTTNEERLADTRRFIDDVISDAIGNDEGRRHEYNENMERVKRELAEEGIKTRGARHISENASEADIARINRAVQQAVDSAHIGLSEPKTKTKTTKPGGV